MRVGVRLESGAPRSEAVRLVPTPTGLAAATVRIGAFLARCPALGAAIALAVCLAAWAMMSVSADGGLTPLENAAEEAAYVGGEACAGCHASEADAWRDSHHALAMQHATETSVLGDFNDARITAGGVTSRFFRRDGKFMVETDGADGALQAFEVQFTFGVDPLQQYLVAFPNGRLQALPLAWDTRPEADGGQRWFHLYPDQRIAHDDPLHWTGLQQNWNYMCADCHTTNLRRNFDPANQTYKTTYSELNVSCEACHGPGSEHLAWAADRNDDPSKGLVVALDERRGVVWTLDPETGNSSRSRPRETTREIETCAFCHSRRAPISDRAHPAAPVGDSYRVSLLEEGLYFADGQIRDEVYEYGSFLQSRMFHEGVTCSDCHEPHSATLRAPGNAVCTQCHAEETFATAEHHHHAMDSAGAECASCHMPERTYMVVDPRHDHSMRIPRPDLSVSLKTPNACNGCHADESAQWAADHVSRWAGTPKPGFQRFAQALSDGVLGAPGAREHLLALATDPAHPGIARASALDRLDRIDSPASLAALRQLLEDPDPLVRRAAVEAYRSAPAMALPDLLPLLDDPVRDVRLAVSFQLAAIPPQELRIDARLRRERGIEEYIAAQRANADRPEAHHNLGGLFMTLGRITEAEASLRTALATDAAFVPAAVTLADLYRASGRDAEGEPVLRAMIARQPQEPAPHHALGLWLIRNGGTPSQAISELKLAARLGVADARYGYVYAVALAETGDRAAALQALQEVLMHHPNHRDSLYAIAIFEHDAGNAAAATRYAEQLAVLEPGYPYVQRLLAQLRQ
ncbi:MAG: tetratricopeptide repeat protein [Alphaproteobacteria bacterium]